MRELTMPITSVTLFEDRARVRREASLELEEGLTRLSIPALTPVLVDKTLEARVAGSGNRVAVVKMNRKWTPVSSSTDAARPGPDDESRSRRLELVKEELELSETVLRQTLGEAAREVASGSFERAKWDECLDQLASWTEELVERRLELDRPSPRTAPEAPGPSRLEGSVSLLVEAARSGPVNLVLEYTVPGACWRPYHTARLEPGEERVAFRCDACVWQNTGEDWESAEFFFSTQRPSLGIDPPELGTDLLEVRKKQSPQPQVEIREQTVTGLGPTRAPSPGLDAAGGEPPGLDDGGETVNLRALGRATVPSHGQPVRLELFSFEAPTRLERVLMGELTPDVLLKTVFENTGPHPILAGPVDLIRGSGVVGRSACLYVAPGEAFALGWGPDPGLRVRRRAESGEDAKADLTGRWRKTDHTVTLKLSNLGVESRTIQVVERVPVSEVKEVEVVCQEVTPDENGFVRWEVELGPRGRRQLQLQYALRRHRKVAAVSP